MYARIRSIVAAMGKWERIALLAFIVLFVASLLLLLHRFYLQNTSLIATKGGTYIEGSVGQTAPLNPWFTVENDVNRDIVSLVFAGLLKYDPASGEISDDLATMSVSEDRKIYTLKLKDGLQWQDSTVKDPHPVTADDVLFTFKTVQDPAFPNQILSQNFRGVVINKIDEQTVQFKLDEPYNFFPSNLTLGLLPARSFAGVPVSQMEKATDFGSSPIGAGPYRFKSSVDSDLSTEITLERFPRPLPVVYQLDRIVFRIFPDYSTLLSDLHNLDGIRLVPRSDKGDLLVPRRFVAESYTLPQYVALFFNMSRPALKDQQLRLGLQLGTDKQQIADAIHEKKIIDTPLLEINQADWHYHFDADAAQGALYSSRWFVPERLRLQQLLERKEANETGLLSLRPIVFLQPNEVLTVTGSFANIEKGSRLNGAKIQSLPTDSGSWIVSLPASNGTGALKTGDNLLRLVEPGGKTVDSFTLYSAPDAATEAKALTENALVELFLKSKNPDQPKEQALAISSLYLDNGFLRLRTPADPPSIRQNEKGETLKLTLLTSNEPGTYAQVAQIVQQEWKKLGVEVDVQIPASREDFQDRLLRRDYDVLLFGESLLDNLDSYPYWHSSGTQNLSGKDNDLRVDAYNLSQYSSFKADSLLKTIRSTTDENERKSALGQLQETLKNDVPAIFLYSPLYTYAHHQHILGVELGKLSLHSDRFLTLQNWYVKQNRVFKPGKSWFSFFAWLPSLL